jgi:hypothetical protein
VREKEDSQGVKDGSALPISVDGGPEITILVSETISLQSSKLDRQDLIPSSMNR